MKGEYVRLGRELLFLQHGSVRLAHLGLDGAEKILWYVREGCIFGEVAFFDPAPVEQHYCACISACSIYAFSREKVRLIGMEHPEALFDLFRSVARKAKVLACQASSLYMDSVLVRLCKFLSQRITPGSNPLIANIGISRQDMASLLGVHRTSLYRVLRQQEKRGLFGPITNNAMIILRPDDFYTLAGM